MSTNEPPAEKDSVTTPESPLNRTCELCGVGSFDVPSRQAPTGQDSTAIVIDGRCGNPDCSAGGFVRFGPGGHPRRTHGRFFNGSTVADRARESDRLVTDGGVDTRREPLVTGWERTCPEGHVTIKEQHDPRARTTYYCSTCKEGYDILVDRDSRRVVSGERIAAACPECGEASGWAVCLGEPTGGVRDPAAYRESDARCEGCGAYVDATEIVVRPTNVPDALADAVGG